MNKIHSFTSFNFNYLAKARVLASTVKKFHPDWQMHACLCDREPEGFEFDLDNEPFDSVTWADDLDIPNLSGWLFSHQVVELCTAVKGTMMRMLLEQGAEKVIYLDPDIAVFDTLTPLVELLDSHDIILTPHQIDPDTARHAIIDNEICSLMHGTYNLGFVAVANRDEGVKFADWWERRLLGWCYENIPNGIFVDQKWCDLAPAFFGTLLILRDPGYNVASWNIIQRKISIDPNGQILAAGHPLRFFHFTKLGPVGEVMTQKHAKDNYEVYELWRWYQDEVKRFSERNIPKSWWYYGKFANGQPINNDARSLYRNRQDLKNTFSDPFGYEDGCQFYSWLQNEHYRSWA